MSSEENATMTTNKHTVIFADDDADDRELIQEVFSMYAGDLELRSFDNGFKALCQLKEWPRQEATPCLIILDINMPVMNGKEVLHHLRQLPRFQQTPVILFTTSSVQSDISFAKAHGAQLITKPTSYEKIKLVAQQFADACADEVKRKIRIAAAT